MGTQPASTIMSAEAVVVGAGPAGLVAAIGLARSNIATVLVTGPDLGPDHRATALMAGSVQILKDYGLWDRLHPHAAALRDMRIIDATRRLVRAPQVTFRAAEIGLEAFGYTIENEALRRELKASAHETQNLRVVRASLTDLVAKPDQVQLDLDCGTRLSTRLVVAADGRQSTVRKLLGLTIRTKTYPQVALTCTVRHSRPHEDISTEFHTEHGPFTLVPLPGNRSSIVCVVNAGEAAMLMDLDDEALARELERRCASILGALTLDPGRGSFPLSTQIASALVRARVALVAEAAHVMPPIGAQGLNLGLRDVEAIVRCAGAAAIQAEDPGAACVLERYAQERRSDIEGLTRAVDLLNRSLLSDFVPIQGMRGLGLYLLDRVGPLRRRFMRAGAGTHAA